MWWFIAFYLAMWYFTAGLFFAHLQWGFSSIAKESLHTDRAASIAFSTIWPATVWAAIGYAITDNTGWLNPFSNPHKKKEYRMKRSKRKAVVSALVSKILMGGCDVIFVRTGSGDSPSKEGAILVAEVDGKLISARPAGLFGTEVQVRDPGPYNDLERMYGRGHPIFVETVSHHFFARKMVKQKIKQIAVEKLEAKIKEREAEQLRVLKQVGLDFSKE